MSSAVIPQEETAQETKQHRQLVEIAYKWVIANTSCGVAFKELNTIEGEYPDVIGFGSGTFSVVIEVKVSRADFLQDKKKRFRKNPEMGMGYHRYYCCPTGLIKKEELPQGWGLIYVNDKQRARCIYSPYKGSEPERFLGFCQNIKAEHGFMYSVLRRLQLRDLVDAVYIPTQEDFERSEAAKRVKKLREEQKARTDKMLYDFQQEQIKKKQQCIDRSCVIITTSEENQKQVISKLISLGGNTSDDPFRKGRSFSKGHNIVFIYGYGTPFQFCITESVARNEVPCGELLQNDIDAYFNVMSQAEAEKLLSRENADIYAPIPHYKAY